MNPQPRPWSQLREDTSTMWTNSNVCGALDIRVNMPTICCRRRHHSGEHWDTFIDWTWLTNDK